MKNNFAPLNDICEVMKGFQKPWFICGGWAIDLALGHKTREHKDIDIGIFREDQFALRDYLNDWVFYTVTPDEDRKIVTWEREEYLNLPIHETRAQKEGSEVEFLFNDTDGASWVYRRNNNVRFPKDALVQYRDNIPYWAPEISLLYKAKAARAHDEKDFKAIVDTLSKEARAWLREAIQDTHPGHPWIEKLEG